MREIVIEVPDRCGPDCPLYKSGFKASSIMYWCPYRKETSIPPHGLKPVKACRDAEVKK